MAAKKIGGMIISRSGKKNLACLVLLAWLKILAAAADYCVAARIYCKLNCRERNLYRE